MRPWLSLASLTALALAACSNLEVPQGPLTTPTPSPVDGGFYRLHQLALQPLGTGRDLDGDGTQDNNFPYLLDQLYTTLETLLIPVLTEQLGDQATAEQAWTLLSTVMEGAGLPISAAAYNGALADAIREGQLHFINNVQAKETAVTATLSQGVSLPDGYQTGLYLGTWAGVPQANTALPAADIVDGQLEIAYPTDFFSLECYELVGAYTFSSAGISNADFGGAIPAQAIAEAVLYYVPKSLEVNGQVILIPVDKLASELTGLLLLMTDEDGAPLFDVTINDSQPAISAAYAVEALPVQKSAQPG